jgi:1,4-dihydroxy-2-naphthoyl-CoA hydrolase
MRSSIWFGEVTLEHLRELETGTFANFIGVEFTKLGADYLAGRMEVTSHHLQPFGVLHGGASVALAETLGSVGANFTIDRTRFRCVGQAINASHLRPVNAGYIHGVARQLDAGQRIQVWSIDIRGEDDRLICVSRLTVAMLQRALRPV